MTVSEAEFTKQRDYVTGRGGVTYHVPTVRTCNETLTILAARLKTLQLDGRQRDIEDLRADIDLLLERRTFLALFED
jgi:hypothetical protein